MARVIAIANQKGGVGKTTTTLSLGAALAESGKKVLLVDLDQQGSLGISVGINPDALDKTVYNVLRSYADIQDDDDDEPKLPMSTIVHHVDSINVDIAPANIDLAALELELINVYKREDVLRSALKVPRTEYDYILLDCPPSLGLLVVNALTAADEVVIPLQAHYLATRGVRQLLKSISKARSRLNESLRVTGILLTMVDPRTSHNRQVIDSIRSTYDGKVKVFDTVIRASVRVQEAPIGGKSILEYDPQGAVSKSYRQLAEEVENDVATV